MSVRPETLRAVGKMLHGGNFVPALAQDLDDMNPRNLQRMLAGTCAIPDALGPELLALIDARRAQIAADLDLLINS